MCFHVPSTRSGHRTCSRCGTVRISAMKTLGREEDALVNYCAKLLLIAIDLCGIYPVTSGGSIEIL